MQSESEPSIKENIIQKAYIFLIYSVEKLTENINLLKLGLKDKMI